MKKIMIVLFLLGSTGLGFAQTKPVKKTTPPPPPLVLKTLNDSISYIMGEISAYGLLQQGLGDVKLNNTAYMRALNDVLGSKKPAIDDATASALITSFMNKAQEKKIQPTIDEGRRFLATNKNKPGVKTTPSGLQYEVITEGTGIKPTLQDTFVVHYRGTLLNGTEFDASYNRGQPLVYPLTKVIQGWQEGLQLMSVGSKYKFYIPYELAYGVTGQGQIPGGAMLIFDLELLDVKKQQ